MVELENKCDDKMMKFNNGSLAEPTLRVRLTSTLEPDTTVTETSVGAKGICHTSRDKEIVKWST